VLPACRLPSGISQLLVRSSALPYGACASTGAPVIAGARPLSALLCLVLQGMLQDPESQEDVPVVLKRVRARVAGAEEMHEVRGGCVLVLQLD